MYCINICLTRGKLSSQRGLCRRFPRQHTLYWVMIRYLFNAAPGTRKNLGQLKDIVGVHQRSRRSCSFNHGIPNITQFKQCVTDVTRIQRRHTNVPIFQNVHSCFPTRSLSVHIARKPFGLPRRCLSSKQKKAKKKASGKGGRGGGGSAAGGSNPPTGTLQQIMTMTEVRKLLPGGKELFGETNLSFNYGAKIGVLGVNGSGKSTVLKILAGVGGSTRGSWEMGRSNVAESSGGGSW